LAISLSFGIIKINIIFIVLKVLVVPTVSVCATLTLPSEFPNLPTFTNYTHTSYLVEMSSDNSFPVPHFDGSGNVGTFLEQFARAVHVRKIPATAQKDALVMQLTGRALTWSQSVDLRTLSLEEVQEALKEEFGMSEIDKTRKERALYTMKQEANRTGQRFH
jgi:hypothetical protein